MQYSPEPHHLLDTLALEGVDPAIIEGAKTCDLACQFDLIARKKPSDEEINLVRDLREAFKDQQNRPFFEGSERKRWTEFLPSQSDIHRNEAFKVGVDAFRAALRKEEAEMGRSENPDEFDFYVKKIRHTLKMQEAHLDINGIHLSKADSNFSLPLSYMSELCETATAGNFRPAVIKEKLEQCSQFIRALTANYKLHRTFFNFYDRQMAVVFACIEVYQGGLPGSEAIPLDFNKFITAVYRINQAVENIRINMHADGLDLR